MMKIEFKKNLLKNALPARITTSASLSASFLQCLNSIELAGPSRPRDMPPRKHGIFKFYKKIKCKNLQIKSPYPSNPLGCLPRVPSLALQLELVAM